MTVTIFNMMGRRARAAIEATGLDVDIVDITADGPEDGMTGEILFGGFGDGAFILPYLDRGVLWVQLPGTGTDNMVPAVFDGDRVVTNVPGASAIPISEFVLGAML